MHDRIVQLAALTISLAAHGALMTGLSNNGLNPEGASMPASRVVKVAIRASSPVSPGETLPAAEPVDSPLPESPPAPEPEASPAEAPLPAASQPAPQAVAAALPETAAQPPAELQATRTLEPRPADTRRSPGPESSVQAAAAPAAQRAQPAHASPPRATPPPQSAEAGNAATHGPASAGRREHYLAELLAHIEANKFYPRSARRRRLEGDVEVAFRLLDDGRVQELDLDSGPALLRSAARRTLERAAPMPQPPQGIGAPLPVRFVMRYRLR